MLLQLKQPRQLRQKRPRLYNLQWTKVRKSGIPFFLRLRKFRLTTICYLIFKQLFIIWIEYFNENTCMLSWQTKRMIEWLRDIKLCYHLSPSGICFRRIESQMHWLRDKIEFWFWFKDWQSKNILLLFCPTFSPEVHKNFCPTVWDFDNDYFKMVWLITNMIFW